MFKIFGKKHCWMYSNKRNTYTISYLLVRKREREYVHSWKAITGIGQVSHGCFFSSSVTDYEILWTDTQHTQLKEHSEKIEVHHHAI